MDIYYLEDEGILGNLARESVALRRTAIKNKSPVTRQSSARRRVRIVFRNLWIVIRSGYRELVGILEIPLMMGLFVADVVVVLPLGLFFAFFTQDLLFGILYVAVTQSPIIYWVLKRIWHESHYASIPKEGWEGPSLDNLPEAIEIYKKFLSKQKHEEEE